MLFREGTLGTTVRELALPEINLIEARFAPGQILPWHGHERSSVTVLLDGANTVEFRTAAYELNPFDVAFKPREAEHRNRYGTGLGARCLIIELEQRWMDALAAKGPLLATPWSFSSRALPDVGRRLYEEFVKPDDLTALSVEMICAELMVQAARSSRATSTSHPPPWLQKVREMLHEYYRERLSLEQLAQIAAVHPVHLAQTFRLVYSCTIGEYVRHLRVARATDELVRTHQPLAEIAIRCGFYDQSHFNRVFKKYVKVTPAEYRRRHGQGAPAVDD
jgi:AraC family transcriptional regulator